MLPALTLMLCLPMTGCVTLTGGTSNLRYIDTACSAFSNITYSSRDTEPTVAQVRGHNAAYDTLCKGGN
jgi:hypothetical protein